MSPAASGRRQGPGARDDGISAKSGNINNPNPSCNKPSNNNNDTDDDDDDDDEEEKNHPSRNTSATVNNRKRGRHTPEDSTSPVCAQCRARKVRCDRQQPECSNCRKAGVSCDFSNSFKRVNHAKQLLQEFSAVASRLDRVEQSLAQLTDQIQHQRRHAVSAVAVSLPSVSSPRPGVDFYVDGPMRHHHLSVEQRRMPASELVEVESGDRRMLGYPASLSLFKSLQRRLAQALTESHSQDPQKLDNVWAVASRNSTLRLILERQLEAFPFAGQCREPVIMSDHRPISTPPRALLELSLDSFLRHVNVHIPIFNEAALEKAIDDYYPVPPAERNSAQALSFSNIILLTMALDSRVTQAASATAWCMDDDLMPSFLRNCDRALMDLDAFSGPSMANLEALVTLALVTREFYGSMVFGKVCQRACQVVRAMGLHRAPAGPREKSWESMSEHERLFWVVYSLDKQQVFLSGHPCDLYLFDSDLSLYSCGEHTPLPQQLHAAFVHLITVWEEIYVALYSLRATMAGDPHRSRQIQQLRNLLRQWQQKHQKLLNAPFSKRSPEQTALQLELRYGFHIGQILIQRYDRSERPQQRFCDSARAALKLIGEVARSPVTPHRCAVLARMFRNYPMVAFHDLFLFSITAGASELASNAPLLHETRRHLEPLLHPDFPESYYTKLYAALLWCTDQLDIIQEANLSKTTSSPVSAGWASPQSTTGSSAATGTVPRPAGGWDLSMLHEVDQNNIRPGGPPLQIGKDIMQVGSRGEMPGLGPSVMDTNGDLLGFDPGLDVSLQDGMDMSMPGGLSGILLTESFFDVNLFSNFPPLAPWDLNPGFESTEQ